MLDRITAQLQFHGQALALRAQRQQVLASNIANADTPQFQARDFDFAQALRQATGIGASASGQAGGQAARLPLAVPTGASVASTVRALPLAGSGSGTGGVALAWRASQQPSVDGNTVDMDRERANFADNSLRYEATLRFINGNVRNALSAIRGE